MHYKPQMIICLLLLVITGSTFAQRPDYKPKKLLNEAPPATATPAPKDGAHISYLQLKTTLLDVDASGKIPIKFNAEVLMQVSSNYKNGKKSGIVSFRITNAEDTSKHYLIYEQSYKDGKLNGPWKIYNLAGTMVKVTHHKDDSLHGLSTEYLPDGITRMSEAEYFNGTNKYIARAFNPQGQITEEMAFENGMRNGEAKRFYETGTVMEKITFRDDVMHGEYAYYYPDGKPWIKHIIKNGNFWEVIANYDSKGNKRDAGTLKNGNGTIIYYDSDTVVRETIMFKDGKKVK